MRFASQNSSKTEWKVPIQRDLAFPSPTTFAIRSFISLAALLVKVSAKILKGSIPLVIKCAILIVRTLVLPEPAPTKPSMVGTKW